MNDRSQRRLRIALTSLAAAALVAAACGASTAHADSIVYVKDNAIWASTPTANGRSACGRPQVRLTLPGRRRHDRRARRRQPPLPLLARRKADRKPVLTWLGLNGGQASLGHIGRASPPTARRSHSRSCIRKASTRSPAPHEVEGGTSYTLRRPDDAARPAWRCQGLGQPRLDRQPPHHDVQTRRRLVRGLGERRRHELGHAVRPPPTTCTTPTPGSTTPPRRHGLRRHHAVGDKLAVGEDGFAATRTIRFYSVAARPPFKDDAPVYRCSLESPKGAGYESVSGRRTATSLAYQTGGSIYVVHVGSIANGCTLGKPRLLVAGGTSPSWGKADVVARAAR